MSFFFFGSLIERGGKTKTKDSFNIYLFLKDKSSLLSTKKEKKRIKKKLKKKMRLKK